MEEYDHGFSRHIEEIADLASNFLIKHCYERDIDTDHFISNIFQVENDSVLVNMVSFSGYAEGEYFKGNILPGTVDTQTVLPDGSTHLSARYMLKGIDQMKTAAAFI